MLTHTVKHGYTKRRELTTRLHTYTQPTHMLKHGCPTRLHTYVYTTQKARLCHIADICRYAIVLGWLRGTDILKHES